MTADERFALIWHKIERANKHIRDLGAAIASFNASNAYEFGTKNNSQTGQPRYYVSGMQPIPMEIPIIMGDAIQALRTALDHLATQLFLVGSGSSTCLRDTGIFIHLKRSEYERLVGRKVQGMRQDAIDALAALEPYKDGKGQDFWVLHKLNNIDKHRALVATGSGFRSVDFMPIMRASMPSPMSEALEAFPSSLNPPTICARSK